MSEEAAPDAESVVTAFGLTGNPTAWTAVGGAWSNRVFRLEAGGKAFAVKQMRNPWGIGRWQEWLTDAWSVELLAISAGVAAPRRVANPATDGCLAWVSGGGPIAATVPVRLHHWVHGRAFDTAVAVSPEVARWAGQVSATLHGLAVRPRDRSLFPVLNIDSAVRWPELVESAQRSGADWAGLMAAAAQPVAMISDLATSSGCRPGEEVMSHGDIDQKNLISTGHGPVLCDWDMAVPLVPRREMADVAMSLACWQDFSIARELVRAYRAHGGDDTAIVPSDLGQPMMTGLDWIVFNVERALGRRAAGPADIEIANRLLPQLLRTIPSQLGCAVRISDILQV